jgi:hypothetical protein
MLQVVLEVHVEGRLQRRHRGAQVFRLLGIDTVFDLRSSVGSQAARLVDHHALRERHTPLPPIR